ncbi:MAG: glycosyl hydrolase, partial [Armatimonadota bacterium]|nr:glycosyl hydrolase [Armatimonadota bacterium]
APGQQKTFTFIVTAPSTAGTYNFQWRMVQDGVQWFGDLTPNVAVTVIPLQSTPPASDVRIYFGVYTGGVSSGLMPPTVELAQFESDTGKNASILGFAAWWFDTFAWGDFNTLFKGWADNVRANGSIPLILWMPFNPYRSDGTAIQNTDPDYPAQIKKYSSRNIAAGNSDAYIRLWARQIKEWGHPIILRTMHELNGTGSLAAVADIPYGEAWYAKLYDVDGSPINEPQDSINAWRHIVDIFRAEGVTNVTWVWSVLSWPSASFGGNNTIPMSSIYPGDGYVDWIGIECYNFSAPWQQCYGSNVSGAYLEASALSASKPMMMAEMGSREDPGDPIAKAEWIKSALALDRVQSIPNIYPRVRGIFWWNSGETWIESSIAAVAAFKEALA